MQRSWGDGIFVNFSPGLFWLLLQKNTDPFRNTEVSICLKVMVASVCKKGVYQTVCEQKRPEDNLCQSSILPKKNVFHFFVTF